MHESDKVAEIRAALPTLSTSTLRELRRQIDALIAIGGNRTPDAICFSLRVRHFLFQAVTTSRVRFQPRTCSPVTTLGEDIALTQRDIPGRGGCDALHRCRTPQQEGGPAMEKDGQRWRRRIVNKTILNLLEREFRLR